MPCIHYESRHFPPGPVQNGTFECYCSWADLVWAAVTVGKRELFDVVRHGQFSLFETVYRSTMLFANLKENGDQELVRSDVYDGLDPSEKAATSYFLGLTAAKLFAELYLDVAWLMHLDVYRDRVRAELSGRSRPDLLGRNGADEWIVIESKGRSGGRDGTALEIAKNQATEIDTIGGERPALYVALLAHFGGGRLCVEWEDPESPRDKREKVAVDVSPIDLEEGYYRPFKALFEQYPGQVERRVFANEPYDTLRVDNADLRIGLATERRPTANEPFRRGQRIHGEDTVAAGSDGVLIELGPAWSNDNMRLEPQARAGPRVR